MPATPAIPAIPAIQCNTTDNAGIMRLLWLLARALLSGFASFMRMSFRLLWLVARALWVAIRSLVCTLPWLVARAAGALMWLLALAVIVATIINL
jgi:hypothetical protein